MCKELKIHFIIMISLIKDFYENNKKNMHSEIIVPLKKMSNRVKDRRNLIRK